MRSLEIYSLTYDETLVARLEKRAERLYDAFIALNCHLPYVGWVNGDIDMEWIGLKGCGWVLRVTENN